MRERERDVNLFLGKHSRENESPILQKCEMIVQRKQKSRRVYIALGRPSNFSLKVD